MAERNSLRKDSPGFSGRENVRLMDLSGAMRTGNGLHVTLIFLLGDR